MKEKPILSRKHLYLELPENPKLRRLEFEQMKTALREISNKQMKEEMSLKPNHQIDRIKGKKGNLDETHEETRGKSKGANQPLFCTIIYKWYFVMLQNLGLHKVKRQFQLLNFQTRLFLQIL